ncbi:MAG TPA: cysteine--tRNA ligase [Candidatus Limnocylindrales bacterium]
MGLHLRNTLTRRTEAIEPLLPGQVRMYSCGPTVYRYAHVGNLRTFLLADFIRRALLYHGIEVFQVQNITDVGHLRDERFDHGEDRMLVAAGLEGRPPDEIAAAYEAAFHGDAAAVNILPAHVYPRASDHIAEMVGLIERLEDAGRAYATAEGNVYYAVAGLEGYGRLSGNSLDELRAGHRGTVEPDKRDPADFALWKHAGPGRLLRWPTARWGDGFPGWHIECSAMAIRYLGDEFDIHTGGVDNVFPHHEDEIAQVVALTGRPPARVWVHGEHLLQSGRKMAKSAGNFLRITELGEEGIEPLAFRYLVLTVHYSRKLNLSDASIRAAATSLTTLRARLRALGAPPAEGPWAAPTPLVAGRSDDRPTGVSSGLGGLRREAPGGDDGTPFSLADRAGAPTEISAEGRSFHERFVAAIDDDLDLPAALAVVRELLRSPLSPDEKRWLALDADHVLGLDLHRVWERATAAYGARGVTGAVLPPEVGRLVAERAEARALLDFVRADAIRARLGELDWEVLDRADGTSEVRRPERSRA